ncbi:hypothetical protein [Streptomyces sp. NPDC012888]|uniref:hypothetical protein n=1 Tax=Streptomyces sp. NPDC012888 TaxID=3364855 RepID=UPI0036B18132
MPHHRRIAATTGATLLLLAATACSADRTTVGPLSFRAHDSPIEVTYNSTSVNGCHRIGLPRGAAHVENNTLVDVILYRTRDCRKLDKQDGTYIPTETSNVTAPHTLPWRSFSVVH